MVLAAMRWTAATMRRRPIPVGLLAWLLATAAPAVAEDLTAAVGLDGGLRVRGLVTTEQRAVISSRLQATIAAIGPADGESFAAGEALVRFDCASFEASLARAVAAAEAAEAAARVKRELAATGSVSQLQTILADAELRRARAEVAVVEEEVAQCVIVAPYAGKVVKRIANADETVGFRDPLIEIVGNEGLEIRVYLPSAWMQRIGPGQVFEFHVDETGTTVRARVHTLGARVDNVSQLVELRAKLLDADGNFAADLVAGMSGSADLRALISSEITTGQVLTP